MFCVEPGHKLVARVVQRAAFEGSIMLEGVVSLYLYTV